MQTDRNKTVLIVDDQEMVRDLLRHHLGEFGYRCIEAQNGEQAIAIAQSQAVDSILLDLNMPGIDGIETCRRLRQIQTHAVTPILVITAREESDALALAFEAGCNDFIVKPFNPVVLQARLKSHIQRTELYYQLERVRKTLNRYVSPRTQQIVEQYAQTGRYPEPVKKDVCVMFSDIRGFTQLSQHIEARELFAMLSRHLAYQVDLVYRYSGYVDKFAGDGIMAVFEGEKKAEHACACATDIIRHAQDIIAEERSELFAVGCGLHLGEAVIGNIGSPEHLDYSVVGETVNLAARLCGHAEPMTAIVSSSVFDALREDAQKEFSRAERISIKGFEEKITIYKLLADRFR